MFLKLILAFGSFSLCSAIVVYVIFLFPSNDLKSTSHLLSPASNKYLDSQLLTFKAFNNKSLTYFLKSKKYALNNSDFDELVSKYELVQSGVKDLFELPIYKIVIVDYNYEFKRINYKYETRFLTNNNYIDSHIYFNEIDEKGSDKKIENSIKALYVFDGNMYYVDIIYKEENKQNKSEKEVETLFRSIDESLDKSVLLIKFESEYNGKISDNSYSTSKYESYESYISDDDNFISSIEFEIENNIINVEIEYNESEIELENVTKISGNSYSFYVDEYKTSIETKINDLTVSLLYNEDNSRTYSANNLVIIKNKKFQ